MKTSQIKTEKKEYIIYPLETMSFYSAEVNLALVKSEMTCLSF